MTKRKKSIILKSAIILTGALAGYLYWYYVGCASGACPIYTKWYLSTLYGAAFGYILSGLFIKDTKKNENINQ